MPAVPKTLNVFVTVEFPVTVLFPLVLVLPDTVNSVVSNAVDCQVAPSYKKVPIYTPLPNGTDCSPVVTVPVFVIENT